MAIVNVTYDNYDLQTQNVVTRIADHESLPPREVASYRIVRNDGSKVTDVHYGPKKIHIEGYIDGTSQADLEARLDAVRLALAKTDKNLEIDYLGDVRRYLATLTGLTIKRGPNGTTYADFAAEFDATEAFGKDDTAVTAIGSYTFTTTPNSAVFTAGGTAPEQKPYLTYTINSLTGTGYDIVTIGNPDTGQSISIARTWAAADVIVIDSLNQIVTVNGDELDYSGVFPTYAPGVLSEIEWSDTFTARNVTGSGTYVKRYL